jgi:hypothetical protein
MLIKPMGMYEQVLNIQNELRQLSNEKRIKQNKQRQTQTLIKLNSMTQVDNAKVEGTEVTTKGTSDFSQWSIFIWKLLRSLALVVAGATLVYFICRWLIK